MHTCPHCEQPVVSDAPYCATCGQPRMLESLLAPRVQPIWQKRLWSVVAMVGVFWFLASSSVAFLREAKAVRVARQVLELHNPEMDQRADQILTSFLVDHPEHEAALQLAATAAARLEKLPETAELRSRLEALEPERLAELDPEIGSAIDASVARKGCRSGDLLRYYDATQPLGEAFRSRVLTNVQASVRSCQASQQEREAHAVMVGLVERGVGDSLIEETYLQPLREAVAADRYWEVESLARGAIELSPDTQAAVDQALQTIRRRVDASVRSVGDACEAVRTAPNSRVGRFWCFPEATPASVAAARDGWNKPLRYNPLQLDSTVQCYQGFEIISYGADGQETPEPTGRPEGDIVCRFTQGRTTTQEPSSFWRVQS